MPIHCNIPNPDTQVSQTLLRTCGAAAQDQPVEIAPLHEDPPEDPPLSDDYWDVKLFRIRAVVP